MENQLIEPFEHDHKLIEDWENGRGKESHTVAYVPTSKSGITIGTGLDLSKNSLDDFKAMGFSKELIEKLKPYVGKDIKGQVGEDLLKKKPLIITKKEVKQIDKLVIIDRKKKVKKAYNKYVPGRDFNSLTKTQKSVLLAVYMNTGNLHLLANKEFITNFRPGEECYQKSIDCLINFKCTVKGIENRRQNEGRCLQEEEFNRIKQEELKQELKSDDFFKLIQKGLKDNQTLNLQKESNNCNNDKINLNQQELSEIKYSTSYEEYKTMAIDLAKKYSEMNLNSIEQPHYLQKDNGKKNDNADSQSQGKKLNESQQTYLKEQNEIINKDYYQQDRVNATKSAIEHQENKKNLQQQLNNIKRDEIKQEINPNLQSNNNEQDDDQEESKSDNNQVDKQKSNLIPIDPLDSATKSLQRFEDDSQKDCESQRKCQELLKTTSWVIKFIYKNQIIEKKLNMFEQKIKEYEQKFNIKNQTEKDDIQLFRQFKSTYLNTHIEEKEFMEMINICNSIERQIGSRSGYHFFLQLLSIKHQSKQKMGISIKIDDQQQLINLLNIQPLSNNSLDAIKNRSEIQRNRDLFELIMNLKGISYKENEDLNYIYLKDGFVFKSKQLMKLFINFDNVIKFLEELVGKGIYGSEENKKDHKIDKKMIIEQFQKIISISITPQLAFSLFIDQIWEYIEKTYIQSQINNILEDQNQSELAKIFQLYRITAQNAFEMLEKINKRLTQLNHQFKEVTGISFINFSKQNEKVVGDKSKALIDVSLDDTIKNNNSKQNVKINIGVSMQIEETNQENTESHMLNIGIQDNFVDSQENIKNTSYNLVETNYSQNIVLEQTNKYNQSYSLLNNNKTQSYVTNQTNSGNLDLCGINNQKSKTYNQNNLSYLNMNVKGVDSGNSVAVDNNCKNIGNINLTGLDSKESATTQVGGVDMFNFSFTGFNKPRTKIDVSCKLQMFNFSFGVPQLSFSLNPLSFFNLSFGGGNSGGGGGGRGDTNADKSNNKYQGQEQGNTKSNDGCSGGGSGSSTNQGNGTVTNNAGSTNGMQGTGHGGNTIGSRSSGNVASFGTGGQGNINSNGTSGGGFFQGFTRSRNNNNLAFRHTSNMVKNFRTGNENNGNKQEEIVNNFKNNSPGNNLNPQSVPSSQNQQQSIHQVNSQEQNNAPIASNNTSNFQSTSQKNQSNPTGGQNQQGFGNLYNSQNNVNLTQVPTTQNQQQRQQMSFCEEKNNMKPTPQINSNNQAGSCLDSKTQKNQMVKPSNSNNNNIKDTQKEQNTSHNSQAQQTQSQNQKEFVRNNNQPLSNLQRDQNQYIPYQHITQQKQNQHNDFSNTSSSDTLLHTQQQVQIQHIGVNNIHSNIQSRLNTNQLVDNQDQNISQNQNQSNQTNNNNNRNLSNCQGLFHSNQHSQKQQLSSSDDFEIARNKPLQNDQSQLNNQNNSSQNIESENTNYQFSQQSHQLLNHQPNNEYLNQVGNPNSFDNQNQININSIQNMLSEFVKEQQSSSNKFYGNKSKNELRSIMDFKKNKSSKETDQQQKQSSLSQITETSSIDDNEDLGELLLKQMEDDCKELQNEQNEEMEKNKESSSSETSSKDMKTEKENEKKDRCNCNRKVKFTDDLGRTFFKDGCTCKDKNEKKLKKIGENIFSFD